MYQISFKFFQVLPKFALGYEILILGKYWEVGTVKFEQYTEIPNQLLLVTNLLKKGRLGTYSQFSGKKWDAIFFTCYKNAKFRPRSVGLFLIFHENLSQ